MSRSAARSPDRLLKVAALLLVTGCGGGDPASSDPPTLTLTLTPSSASVDQGGSVIVSGTAIVGGSFTGDVTVTLVGWPAGLTGVLSDIQVSGSMTTVTVTLTAAATVAPGTYDLVVRASGSGIMAEATFQLTVNAAPPSYTIGLDTETLVVEQGASGIVAVTLNRINFTGDVTLSLGTPGSPVPGVTGSYSPNPASGAGSTLTVSVGSGVAVGDHDFVVAGASSLADQNTPFVLRVVAPMGFSLSSVADLTVQQGGSGMRDVTIDRTGGFAGAVTIAVEGLTQGITASVSPNPTTGNTATITVNVPSGAPLQTYNPTIRGTADGEPDALTSMNINVVAPGGAAVSLDFSACSASDRPVWLAVQDGSGPWTQVPGVADVYDFTVSGASAGVAYAITPFGEPSVFVQYLSQGEWSQSDLLQFCDTDVGTKTIDATLANSVGLTNVTLGGVIVPFLSDGAFQFTGVANGPLDLVAYSSSLAGADRMLVLREQDIPDGGDIGTIDMVNGYAAISASITVGGLTGGEVLLGGMDYATVSTGNSCALARISFGGLATPYTAGGYPGIYQAADDYHVAFVQAFLNNGIQTVRESFHTLGPRTVTLGSPLPAVAPTDVTAGGSYLRLQAAFALPPEYNGFVTLVYADGGPRSVAIFASNAAQSGNVSLSLPDFSAVGGWSDAWAPAANASNVTWGVTAFNDAGVETLCAEGVRAINATQAGVFN